MMNKRYLVATIIISSLAVFFNAFIIMQSCLDGLKSSASSGLVVNLLKAIINGIHKDAINEANIDTFTYVIRKLIGHFGFFHISGVLTSLSIHMVSKYLKQYRYYMGIIFSLSLGLFLAGLTELIQIFIPDRSGEVVDVLIDFGGYALGTGILILILFLIIRHQKQKSEKVQ